MALLTLNYTFPGIAGSSIEKAFSHTGMVGSGDLEILMERKEQDGAVTVEVVTPVRGFDYIWERVLGDFVKESGIGDLSISINDNNATPFVVALRLKQALTEARGGTAHE